MAKEILAFAAFVLAICLGTAAILYVKNSKEVVLKCPHCSNTIELYYG